jgi:hypothetical protein
MEDFFRSVGLDLLVLGLGLVLASAAIIYAAETMDAGKAAIAGFWIVVVVFLLSRAWVRLARIRAAKKE